MLCLAYSARAVPIDEGIANPNGRDGDAQGLRPVNRARGTEGWVCGTKRKLRRENSRSAEGPRSEIIIVEMAAKPTQLSFFRANGPTIDVGVSDLQFDR